MNLVSWSSRFAFLSILAGLVQAGEAQERVMGLIRIWGHPNARALVDSWEKGFHAKQPGVRFETGLRGDASAIGGLYTGAADIAFMGREILPIEIDAYRQGLQRDPFEIQVITGGLGSSGYSPTPVVFVHTQNPLTGLTIGQLAAIFGTGPGSISKWGGIGLTGDWADQPIRMYTRTLTDDIVRFLETAIFAGGRKWNCSCTEAAGPVDRYGIVLATMAYRDTMIKPVALAADVDKTYFAPTENTLTRRTYPLTRIGSMFINRIPGKPLEPSIRQFLLYLLSPEGQASILNLTPQPTGYLPLDVDLAELQRRKLD